MRHTSALGPLTSLDIREYGATDHTYNDPWGHAHAHAHYSLAQPCLATSKSLLFVLQSHSVTDYIQQQQHIQQLLLLVFRNSLVLHCSPGMSVLCVVFAALVLLLLLFPCRPCLTQLLYMYNRRQRSNLLIRVRSAQLFVSFLLLLASDAHRHLFFIASHFVLYSI